MSFNLFGSPSQDDIRVGYIHPSLGYVDGVSVCEANDYAKDNPGTTFVFRDGDNNIRYLNINEVNALTPNDLIAKNDKCGGIQEYKECGPPRIQFFGGGGIGAVGNPVIGRDGSLLAVDVVSGGHGYQYPPIVSANDDCEFGNGAVLTAVLGETADEIEVFEGEDDFEDYEICEDTDVGYGARYGANGEELGPWEPQTYTRVGADPIQREIEIFQKALKKPFWTTREKQPDRVITPEKLYPTQDTTAVTFPEWGEFMNQYAVSPVKPSDVTGSDESGKVFSMEWELNFPISGEYIFRGVCDNTAQVYIDNSLVGNLKGFKDNPSPLQKTIQEGNHIVKVDLLNIPITEKVNAPVSTPSTVDVTFTITGDGRNTDKMKFSFVSDNYSFTLNGNSRSGQSRKETIKINPNSKFRITASSTKSGGVEQGIVKNGTKNREGGIGDSDRIFADHIQSDNDNDDIQIATNIGSFKAINKRETPDGRSTFDLIFEVGEIEASSEVIDIISSKSWYGNPMGVSMIIDAPIPPVPQEQLPIQIGSCPPNPIWTTRFSGSDQTWYPVRFRTWSKFMNRYAISPILPLDTPGSDSSGINFTNTWQVDLPYAGYYGVKGTCDNTGRILIDGKEVYNLAGFNVNNPKISKVYLTKGRHSITVEVANTLVEQTSIIDTKIFSTGDWRVPSTSESSSTTRTSQSSTKNGVSYSGPSLFGYIERRWSKYMNEFSVSPRVTENVGKFILTWAGVDFPYAGTYKFNFQADNNAVLKVGGREIFRTSDFIGEKIQYTFNATPGKYDIVIELENIRTERGGQNDSIFERNPMGVALFISKDVAFTDTNRKSWTTNPMGASAILIPPPCAKKIGGRGVVDKVIITDPGNGYLPPLEQGPGYPVTLVLDEVIVENPGINYRCGEDQIQITPNNGAQLSYDCDSFGRIKSVKVLNPGIGFNVYPEIKMVSPLFPNVPAGVTPGVLPDSLTGINASFRPVFRVVRDPVQYIEDQKVKQEALIQVTDLVGLKQTGYVDGRAYYGAIYYDEGIPFAGYYKTAGPQTRVYATLQESITARVTTPPSAIQRSGTDIRSNDPRLNIPGTPESTSEQ